MKRLPIQNVRPGDQIATNLYFDSGVPMLSAGAELTENMLDTLEKNHFSILIVCDEDTEDVRISPLLEEEKYCEIRTKLGGIFQDIAEVVKKDIEVEKFQRILTSGNKDQLRSLFRMHFGQAFLSRSLEIMVTEIMKSLPTEQDITMIPAPVIKKNRTILDYSIYVMVYSMILALSVGFSSNETKKIGQGALLHDIGFAFYPEVSPYLDEQDFALDFSRQYHPVLGYHLLKIQRSVNLLVSHVAFQHHEYQDGSGYPRGVRGTNRVTTSKKESMKEQGHRIHRYAELVAVPVAYFQSIFQITGERSYSPSVILKAVEDQKGKRYNEEIVDRFQALKPPYPVATPVRSAGSSLEGYTGVVTKVHSTKRARPSVRFLYDEQGERLEEPINLDLREESIQLESVHQLTEA